MPKTICFKNIGELIQVESAGPPKIRIQRNCALVVKDGQVLDVLANAGIRPKSYDEVIDLKKRSVVPGFVDCHTHLIYAGERKEEMVARIQGSTYLEALEEGGGILQTVRETREATEKELYLGARKRMVKMMALGTTAFEIKSGYGLDYETEMKMLKVGHKLRKSLKVPITLTYLGAHAVPPEMNKAAYLETIIGHLKEFRELADGIDIFCERGAFSVTDLRRLFLQARLMGFQIRAHVEELSHSGGCYHAARLGALSCDHLEHALPKDLRAMQMSGTTAVLMPGVTFFLANSQLPPVHTMIEKGIPIALATDCNPGSSPVYNMQTVLYMAAHMYRITPEQAISAATLGSAKALGQEEHFGGLLPDQQADFLVLKTDDYRDLFYYFGDNLVQTVYRKGNVLSGEQP